MNTFKKEERLNSKKTIQSLFANGKSFFNYPFKVYYLLTDSNSSTSTAILFSVGKRQFKKAVDRNKLKRLCREAYRLNKTVLIKKITEHEKHIDIAVVFVGKSIPEYKEIEQKTKKYLEHLTAIV